MDAQVQDCIPALAVSVGQAHRALGIGRNLFYTLVGSGEISMFKIGKRSLVSVSELERVIATRTKTRTEAGKAVTK